MCHTRPCSLGHTRSADDLIQETQLQFLESLKIALSQQSSDVDFAVYYKQSSSHIRCQGMGWDRQQDAEAEGGLQALQHVRTAGQTGFHQSKTEYPSGKKELSAQKANGNYMFIEKKNSL